MKKWFIYVTDHHEGPFTVEEIRQGISEGKFSASGFVWTQGMSDWLPMSAVPDFGEVTAASSSTSTSNTYVPENTGSLSQQVSVQPLSGSGSTGSYSRGGMTDEIAPSGQPAQPSEIEVTGTHAAQPIEAEPTQTTVVEVSDGFGRAAPVSGGIAESRSTGPAHDIELEAPQAASRVGSFANTGFGTAPAPKSGGGFLKAVLIILVLIGGLYGLSKFGVLRPLEDRVRGALVSIPELPDLAPDERAELERAAKSPLAEGPAVAVAVSKADPLSPAFYVGTNLPEGTRFEIYLEGVGATLLNTLEFSGKTEVTVTKNLGKSPGYRAPDGRVIPRGEYRLYVVEAATGQPEATTTELSRLTKVSRPLPPSVPTDRRIVFEKTVFLGQKDATYAERLDKFHSQLKQKAQSELMELKQSIALVDNQFATTQATFERLKKQKLGPVQVKAWKQMETNWGRLDNQLSQAMAKLTPENVKTDYVYGEVFMLLSDVQKKLREIHSFQAMYFDRKTSLAETEDQISKIAPEYDRLLGQLKATVIAIEQDPTDASGLPKKATIAPAPEAPSVSPEAAASPGASS